MLMLADGNTDLLFVPAFLFLSLSGQLEDPFEDRYPSAGYRDKRIHVYATCQEQPLTR